ncbi:hypothetical protein [Burkholderia anthina]|uniref:hypothetical protein n=1 Tax=Burkholderia anthina TaxID=179879 RepID=UPI00158E3355|nr:hypothetical protein [Burkholderia anthina]
MRYTVGQFGINGLVTTIKNQFNGAGAYSGQIGLTWQPSSFWIVAADYLYMKGNQALNDNHANQ